MTYRKTNFKEAEMIPFKKELEETPELLVLDGTNDFFEIAKKYAEKFSSDRNFKLASVIVKDNEIIGIGTNSSLYHEKYGCKRKDKNGKSLYKSGEKYELCPGCNPKTSHSESLAIKNVFVNNLLQEYKNNEKLKTKYFYLLEKLDLGIFETNLIGEIYKKDNYENFLKNIQKFIGKQEFERKYEEIKNKVKDSILFLYGHFWACSTCWQYSKDFGIKNIIVQKEAFKKNENR